MKNVKTTNAPQAEQDQNHEEPTMTLNEGSQINQEGKIHGKGYRIEPNPEGSFITIDSKARSRDFFTVNAILPGDKNKSLFKLAVNVDRIMGISEVEDKGHYGLLVETGMIVCAGSYEYALTKLKKLVDLWD